MNRAHSVATLAYMAGIVDGEGSITITDSSHTQGRSFFSTSLGISSTDEVLIDWIIEHFGGWKGGYTPKQTPKNSRKKVFRWQVTGSKLEHILEIVYPYLVIKKNEADIMLKMRKTFISHTGTGLTPEVLKLRRDYALKLKKLHCRA